MTGNPVDYDVLIVGAGFSGIGAGIALQRAGLHNFAIVDDAEDFGGTWFWNRYPGVAVDVPSFSYQFSYAQKPDWTRSYAAGSELCNYAKDLAEEHGLRSRTFFGRTVTAAAFDESANHWDVTFSDGVIWHVRHIIDGTGVLTVPKRPEIAGLDDFAGKIVHTARWDPDLDLTGKRVAIIGTGASAVQIIPTIAERVEHLTVFQRTPIWCLPKADLALSPNMQSALKRFRPVRWATRALSQAFVELQFPITAHYNKTLHITDISVHAAKAYLRSQVKDPALRKKLTPHYPLGCKRPSFHNTYLSTYNRPDVTLETDPIERITVDGIQTANGTLHKVDVIILATGFKVYEPGNLPKYPVTGRAGQDLDAWWEDNRYRAYQGISVPGFPNYFFVLGPYAWNGASYFNLIENQTRHIVRCLSHARATDSVSVEITERAEQAYFDNMLARRGGQVFWQPGCAGANSYYFDRHGDVPLRPGLSVESMWKSKHFPLSDYTFSKERLTVAHKAR
jgi:cation diffusion facilitator CzcD-associated flavoprotein CzcO